MRGWEINMDVIDRLNDRMNVLRKLGVKIRFEDMQGVSGGLCEINGQKVLMVEVSLPSSDQLGIFEETIAQLRRPGQSAA